MRIPPVKAHQLTPNYFVLPGNIYLFVLLSIVLFAFVSLLASRSKTQDSSLSVRTCVKEMSIYLSDLSLAHIGAIANDLPHWTIHLVLLLSVTLILALYNACFSMDNLHIVFPEYYKTYESILQKPPDNFIIYQSVREQLRRTRSNTTVRRELIKLSEEINMNEEEEIEKRGQNIVLVTGDPRSDCHFLKSMWKSSSDKGWHVTESVDPDASEFTSQFRIRSSILNKTQGPRVLKRVRRYVEMGMKKAIGQQFAGAQMDLAIRNGKSSPYVSQLRQNKPCIDKMEPDLDNYRDVNADATQPVFAWWFCLLIFACLVASGEFIAHRLHQINQHKRNRVVPLTTQVRTHSVV